MFGLIVFLCSHSISSSRDIGDGGGGGGGGGGGFDDVCGEDFDYNVDCADFLI